MSQEEGAERKRRGTNCYYYGFYGCDGGGKTFQTFNLSQGKKRDRNLRFFVAPVGILPEASSSSPQDALYFSAVKAQSKYNGGGKFLVDGCSLKL